MFFSKGISFLGLSTIFLSVFVSCSQTEKTETVTAEITAAQMEGRRAAGNILGPQWKDTTKLQTALIDAKIRQSQYLLEGKNRCAEAYDSAFISTIRAVNPSLAKKLTTHSNAK